MDLNTSKMLCQRLPILDAFVFSLAAYESSIDKISHILQDKYDLPVGDLTLLDHQGRHGVQPFIVGSSSNGYILVSCRGTADLADFCQDLKFLHRRLPSSNCSAHLGFVERAEAIDIDPFLKMIKCGYKIIFTGHSLGGAVASLLALRVLERLAVKENSNAYNFVNCITFGAPLFANEMLAEIINSRFKDLFIHVVMKHDFVPKIIPLATFTQRILGKGTQDHLELLRFSRFALRVIQELTSLPVASFFDAIESKMPPPFRTLLKGMVRLFCPDNSSVTFAFAGHVVILSPYESDVKKNMSLTNPEDLNSDIRKLHFALGLNISMFADHGLSNYYSGIKKGLFCEHSLATHSSLSLSTQTRNANLTSESETVHLNPLSTHLNSESHSNSTDFDFESAESANITHSLSESSSSFTLSAGDCPSALINSTAHSSDNSVVLHSNFYYSHSEGKTKNIFARLSWFAGTVIRIVRHLHTFNTSFIFISVGKMLLTNSILL